MRWAFGCFRMAGGWAQQPRGLGTSKAWGNTGGWVGVLQGTSLCHPGCEPWQAAVPSLAWGHGRMRLPSPQPVSWPLGEGGIPRQRVSEGGGREGRRRLASDLTQKDLNISSYQRAPRVLSAPSRFPAATGGRTGQAEGLPGAHDRLPVRRGPALGPGAEVQAGLGRQAWGTPHRQSKLGQWRQCRVTSPAQRGLVSELAWRTRTPGRSTMRAGRQTLGQGRGWGRGWGGAGSEAHRSSGPPGPAGPSSRRT